MALLCLSRYTITTNRKKFIMMSLNFKTAHCVLDSAGGGAIHDWRLSHQFGRAGRGRADGVSTEGHYNGLGPERILAGSTSSSHNKILSMGKTLSILPQIGRLRLTNVRCHRGAGVVFVKKLRAFDAAAIESELVITAGSATLY
jgi:hypothetical protein